MIHRESEPSSSTSTTSHTSDDTQIPSNLSSNFVMNWVEALATIDCLTMDVSDPMEEVKEVTKIDGSIDDVAETPIHYSVLCTQYMGCVPTQCVPFQVFCQ